MKKLFTSFNRISLFTVSAIAVLVALSPNLHAQTDSAASSPDYFDRWNARVSAAQASQPDWITPLATTTPRLEQEFRYDQNRQTLRNGSSVDIYDGGKGLELIPTEQTEIIITLPPYQVRSGSAAASGFNDWPGVLLKYRLLSANNQTGNYVVSLFAQFGLPTGALVYTNHNDFFTPTIAAGKGFGDFDIQATLGESIPIHDSTKTGNAIVTNVTFQYHPVKLFWPELEMNRTDWVGGLRDGRTQTYLTGGVVIGRFLIGGRSKFIVGLGYQTAISSNYAAAPSTPTFNHNWILSLRATF